MKEIFREKLENIDQTMVRNEYKLWIYQNYFLNSHRFLLTIHDITQTDLKVLDRFTDKYLKKWAGVPQCTTNALFHLRTGLDIKSISQLYEVCHCMSHARTRLQGDDQVNHVLTSKVNRESTQVRKRSITVVAERDFESAMRMNTVGGDRPMFGEFWEQEEQEFLKSIKDHVKIDTVIRSEEEMSEHVKTLTKQGDFLQIGLAERGDVIWKSFIYNMKKGTLKFYLNSVSNTLPTGNNLLQWGKATSDRCKLCQNRETTCHVLNGCKVALDQGKYTWRHDSILQYVADSLDESKYSFYVDIPGKQHSNGGTMPTELLITALRPDITILDKKNKTFAIFELTCPLEPNLKKRHTEKSNKYAHFLTDITTVKPTLECFEIGSRGYLSPDNHSRLKALHAYCKPGIKMKKFKENISAISIYTSYAIYLSRKEPQWTKPPLLGPPFSDS